MSEIKRHNNRSIEIIHNRNNNASLNFHFVFSAFNVTIFSSLVVLWFYEISCLLPRGDTINRNAMLNVKECDAGNSDVSSTSQPLTRIVSSDVCKL